MGKNIQEEIEKLIDEMRGFNNDPKIIDQRVRAIVITKLEEASLWFSKIKAEDNVN